MYEFYSPVSEPGEVTILTELLVHRHAKISSLTHPLQAVSWIFNSLLARRPVLFRSKVTYLLLIILSESRLEFNYLLTVIPCDAARIVPSQDVSKKSAKYNLPKILFSRAFADNKEH